MDAKIFLAALEELHGPAGTHRDCPVTHLNTVEIAARWKGAVATGTLSNWRHLRRGPPFVKVGAKVLYPMGGLASWERLQLKAAREQQVQHG